MIAVLVGLSFHSAKATPITDVPAYAWHHGCGPTAAVSVIGYWDVNGYPNLFDASGWDEVRLTSNVQDQVSSPEHNARYDPKPDDLSQPRSWNSIADWFHTSEGSLHYGWSYQVYADDAFEGYANHRAYGFDSFYESWGAFTWADLVNEINLGNPMMFLVDTNSDGGTDHFVPVFGYEDRGTDGLWYACYTTWSEAESIVWKQFQKMRNPWGVGWGTYVHPISAPIPEPATIFLLGTALVALAAFGRKSKN